MTVVVTCHAKYLALLKECLDSVDSQSVPVEEKILVLDNCPKPDWVKEDWRVLEGSWDNPNPARNLGLKNSAEDWITFFDADNVMPTDYVGTLKLSLIGVGETRAGFLYPDIALSYTDKVVEITPTEWDYSTLRFRTFVDTSSCWSKEALLEVGGWDDSSQSMDDLKVALKISAAGWIGKRSGQRIHLRRHNLENRSDRNYLAIPQELWNARSMAIVCIFSGREEMLNEWMEWLVKVQKPRNCHLYFVKNTKDSVFNKRFNEKVCQLHESNVFNCITVVQGAGGVDCGSGKVSLDKFRNISYNFNMILGKIKEDIIFMTDDDVIPTLDTLSRLNHGLCHRTLTVGAISGVYESHAHAGNVVAALSKEGWTDIPLLNEIQDNLVEIGFAGNGCLMVLNSILQKALPIRPLKKNGIHYGPDAHICESIRNQGFCILLDGGLKCKHLKSRLDSTPKVC